MKREEMEKVTFGSYEFLKKPVMRTVGDDKKQIGWVVVPNVPKDCDRYEMLMGMLEEGTISNEQLAKAAFGQGFDLECRRKVNTEYLAATTTGWSKAQEKAAMDKYGEQAWSHDTFKQLALPSEKMEFIAKYCKEQWLANDASVGDDGWDCDYTVNCWEL
jgi:hypothetical protein